MFLKRQASSYGRFILKPCTEKKTAEITDQQLTLQDHIENLRTKIALKERYNRVLKEDMEENRLGANTILHDLYSEVRNLRHTLSEALNAEKRAVQNALRTHREFQLAMTGQGQECAIAWLDDKIFDSLKRLNLILYRLHVKRMKLEDAELLVMIIEKWPRPGASPWESKAILAFEKTETDIENVKVKMETVLILRDHYQSIRMRLMDERGCYTPMLISVEDQWTSLKREMAALQVMLNDAVKFRDEALKNLKLTEKEAHDNRRKRRKAMSRMTKAVSAVLEKNQIHEKMLINPKNKRLQFGHHDQPMESATTSMHPSQAEFMRARRAKKIELDIYDDRAKRLVDAMHVTNLTEIPYRLDTVMKLGKRLRLEMESKEDLRNLLIKQRDQLMLILCYFKYTGAKEFEESEQHLKDLDSSMRTMEADTKCIQDNLNKYGEVTINVRLGVIAILDRIEQGKKRSKTKGTSGGMDLKAQLKTIYQKLKKLQRQVEDYDRMFGGKDTVHDYANYIKPPPQEHRFIRVGTPEITSESDGDDEFVIDLKVPTRTEIKARSTKFLNQYFMKKGIPRSPEHINLNLQK